jgi:hypothetical protein
MKTLSIVLLFCLLQISSCNNSPNVSSRTETLYIKTTTAEEIGKEMKKSEVVSVINTDYFEVGLSSQTTGGFLAQKDIVEPKIDIPFKSVFFQVCQKEGTNIKFMTTTEFLNFMSAHGYDMVNQIPNNYGADYTFKKKTK